MGKADRYRELLRTMDDWDDFLLAESGLPGRRANLELAEAVADEGDEELFKRYLDFDHRKAPVNSPFEFLAFCGVVGLGELAAHGKKGVLGILRVSASDPRWRIREAVRMALGRLGKVDMESLLSEMERWSAGSNLEKRAAAAALCQPELLTDKAFIRRTLLLLDRITASQLEVVDRKTEEFAILKKGLGYGWSVAVVADPGFGKPLMEKWMLCGDKDVVWVMKENLRKKRLERMDSAWVKSWKGRLKISRKA
jgi:hypothetical protein